MRHRSTKMLLACLSLPLIVSCAGPSVSECSWSRAFLPDAGFEQRWTVGEKQQAVAHNRKVARYCR